MRETSKKLGLVLASLAMSTPVLAVSEFDKEAILNDTPFYSDGVTCAATNPSDQTNTPGPVYVVGDSLSEGMVGQGLGPAFEAKGWKPANINYISGRSVTGGGNPDQPGQHPQSGLDAIDTDSVLVSRAKAIVVELGTNPGGTYSIGSDITAMVNKIRGYNKTAALYWVNIGSVLYSDYATRNQTIHNAAASNNYQVINWFNVVFPHGSPYDFTPPPSPAFPLSGGIHPNAAGYKAMVNLVVSSVTAGSNNSGGVGDTLNGHTLPASSGPAVYESEYDGTNGYFINMRWNAFYWPWDDTVSGPPMFNPDPKEDATFYSHTSPLSQRKRILITNPTNHKSVIALIGDSGPNFSNGYSRTNPPDWWASAAPGKDSGGVHYVLGTPTNYKGWVAGVSKNVISALGSNPGGGYPAGDGTPLTYSWAADQSAQPGLVTSASSSSSASSLGSAASNPSPAASGTLASPHSLPSFIPAQYSQPFTDAAAKFNIEPAAVAAIFINENFYGTDPLKIPTLTWPKVTGPWPTSSAGANGPFQFIPGTWDIYKVDGNNDGVADVQNLTDAAFGNANDLSQNGAAIGAPDSKMLDAFHAYNPGSGTYHLAALDIYHYLIQNAAAGDGNTNSLCNDQGGQIGVGSDGFVFPQVTTQTQLQKHSPTWNGVPSINCTNPVPEMGPGSKLPGSLQDSDLPDAAHPNLSLCHHDYLAADIFNDTGTPVVAPRPGRVVDAHDAGVYGYTVRIYSDPKLGGDGLWYYEAHMLRPPEGGKIFVNKGDPVKAGDQLGVVGTAADAESTTPHTHLDISPIENTFARSYSGTDGPLIDPLPLLKPAFAQLPK